jgi:hypothetical protein
MEQGQRFGLGGHNSYAQDVKPLLTLYLSRGI